MKQKVNRRKLPEKNSQAWYMGGSVRQVFGGKQVLYHPELKFNFPILKECEPAEQSPTKCKMAPESGGRVMSLTLGSWRKPRELADRLRGAVSA